LTSSFFNVIIISFQF